VVPAHRYETPAPPGGSVAGNFLFYAGLTGRGAAR
jgi:hypothetical protein